MREGPSSLGTEDMGMLQRSSAGADAPRFDGSNNFGNNVLQRGTLVSSAGRTYKHTQANQYNSNIEANK